MVRTIQNQIESLEALARYTPADLGEFTVAGLRSRARDCGINSVQRGDSAIAISKARKAEIIQGITLATEAHRKAARVDEVEAEFSEEELREIRREVSEDSLELGVELPQVADRYLSRIAEETKELWDAEKQEWKPTSTELHTIAVRMVRYLDNYVSNKTKDTLAPTTKRQYRLIIEKHMIRYAKERFSGDFYYGKLLENISYVFKGMCRVMVDDASQEKRNYKKKSAKKRASRAAIDPSKAIERAARVLRELDSGTKKTAWKDVSIALALVTGRRMAEIHQTAEFDPVGDGLVRFTGQCKTKGSSADYYRENPSYEIPVLVPVEDVLKGLAWLEERGKRIAKDGDIRQVNRRYSKELGIEVKGWAEDGIRLVRASKSDAGIGAPEDITYHSLREIYALVCSEVMRSDEEEQAVSYVSSILGHGTEDEVTPQAYQSKFTLADLAA